MQYFDYESVAREAGIPQARLAELCALIRREFPFDDMLYELHVLRACMAVRDGTVRLDDILRTEIAAQSA
jgi:hypothetical protein